MPALIYAIAALSAVTLTFLGIYCLLGSNAVRTAMLPATAFSASVSAALAGIILSRYRLTTRFSTEIRTGAVRGMLVALIAHALFGIFFILWLIALSDQSLPVTAVRIVSTLQEMIYTSAYSIVFLPITLIISCATGIALEKRSSQPDA